ncbi:MAG: threonine-phosphate decarboxylase [Phocaeicola sp.]
MIRGHGDDIYGQSNRIVTNFSSNISDHHNHEALHQHLSASIQAIHSYPEPDAHSLVQLLAAKHQIATNTLLVTNGAVEAIYLVAQAFRHKRSTIVVPTFSEYEDACRLNEHLLSYVTNLSQIAVDTELVWLCNPNNPNGYLHDKSLLHAFIASHPDTYFIIDQSYEAFLPREATFTPQEALAHPNLILLHSLTKCYAIPGLRLGYVTGQRASIERISACRMPWSVNQLAIEAGKFLLQALSDKPNLALLQEETHYLMTQLEKIEGVNLLPTHTHFFLGKLVNRKASALKSYLMETYGILIRDASNFRGLDESYFRLATQSREENNRLVKAIKEWI